MSDTTDLAENSAARRSAAGVALLGAALLMIGAFLPWASPKGSYSTWTPPVMFNDGLVSDATYAFILGLAVACLGCVRLNAEAPVAFRLVQIPLGVLVFVAAASNWLEIVRTDGTPGVGLLVVGAGSVLAVLGAFPVTQPGSFASGRI